MKTIALTGHPMAQDAAALQLTALIGQRNLAISIALGVVSRAEAYVVHTGGGEVWHCGPDAPRRELVGLVDRTLGADSFADMGPCVLRCLEQFITKRQVAA